MKYLILPFLLVSLNSSPLFSQTYYPTLDSTNTWSYFNFCMAVRAMFPCTYFSQAGNGAYSEYTGADTIINSQTYKTLKMSICTMGYVREDTAAKRIYFIDNQFNPEIVLYDYSLQVNDTINLNFPVISSIHSSGIFRLDSINNINTVVGIRKIFYLNPVNGGNGINWIESIGCTEDFLYPYAGSQTGWFIQSCLGSQYLSSVFLICFSHENKIYFDSCVYAEAQSPAYMVFDSCSIQNYCSGISEADLQLLSISNNPAINYLIVNTETPIEGNLSYSIYDMKKNICMTGNLNCSSGKQLINVSKLPGGIYILEGKTSKSVSRNKFIISK
jgi:hypothetical protein